jgi:hypothetical protein
MSAGPITSANIARQTRLELLFGTKYQKVGANDRANHGYLPDRLAATTLAFQRTTAMRARLPTG